MTRNYDIQSAIDESIRCDTIVIMEQRLDTQEWADLVNSLAAEAEDYVRITGGDNRIEGNVVEVREYWGTDDDGDAWRIHVHATRG
jgi:hypothetical protein